jgi:hypothetical protein
MPLSLDRKLIASRGSVTHSQAFSNVLNVLVRLNSNGSFDSTFGTNGIVINNLPAGTNGFDLVLIQSDGKGNHGMAVDPGHHRAFLSCEGNELMTVFDLDKHRPQAKFGAGAWPLLYEITYL